MKTRTWLVLGSWQLVTHLARQLSHSLHLTAPDA